MIITKSDNYNYISSDKKLSKAYLSYSFLEKWFKENTLLDLETKFENTIIIVSEESFYFIRSML